MEKKKILISDYLKDINARLDQYNKYKLYDRQLHIEKLDCKKLATKLNVTPATISNLNTDSKFSLISDIATEILDNYYSFFVMMEEENDTDSENIIYDWKMIMWELTVCWVD